LERQASLIAQAEAAVKAAQAEAAFADHEVTRYSRLAEQGAGTVQNAQQARSGVDQARARLANSQAALLATRKQVDILSAQVASADGQLKRAEAGLEKARLDLSYTRITAPVDGMVGERALRIGAYVNPGARLLSVVPLERAYIVGNFQETQLTHVQPGQPVSISVDTFSGEQLHGRVESIAPATGVTFAAVKPDNATGNFTKVVQRIPVKIVFDDGQPLLARLRVGMSVEATIDTHGDTLAGKEVTAR
ncbi:HlyD family efflux transporter periplasmic adaptor subunit, partial [Pseudomonas soli]